MKSPILSIQNAITTLAVCSLSTTAFGIGCYSTITLAPACDYVCAEESHCATVDMPAPNFSANDTVETTANDPEGLKRKKWDFACDVVYMNENAAGFCVVHMSCMQDVGGYKLNGLCPQSPPA
jgi:hypothetical protein